MQGRDNVSIKRGSGAADSRGAKKRSAVLLPEPSVWFTVSSLSPWSIALSIQNVSDVAVCSGVSFN